MLYKIVHRTTYEYSDSISISHHFLRLRPRHLPIQHCIDHEVKVEPAPNHRESRLDYFGNGVMFITMEGAHSELEITASSKVTRVEAPVQDPVETPSWNSVRDLIRGAQIGPALEASEFIFDSPFIRTSDQLAEYARDSFPKGRPILEAAIDLTGRLHKDFKFDPKATTIATPLEQAFKNRRGVCQDFAHIQIACLRSLGLPARYVSGYLETLPPPGKKKLAGADASHAWVSLYCHGLGWIDLDPTNNLRPGSRHITVAWGRDFADVSPVRGVILGAGNHELKVAVDVVPVATPNSEIEEVA